MKKWKSLLLGSLIFSLGSVSAQADETLKMGMTAEPFPPMTAVNSAGEWIGFEADLSRALCKEMKVTCAFVQMAWDGLIPSLDKNKVNFAIGAFSITEERKKAIDFSEPYYTEKTQLIGSVSDVDSIALVDAPDGSGKVVSSAGLKGKTVGTQLSSVQAAYMERYLPDVAMKSYDTADNVLADLTAGRIDYVLSSDMFIRNFLKRPDGVGYEIKMNVPSNPILGNGIAYIARKGDAEMIEKINAGIASLKKKGELDRLIRKWIPDRDSGAAKK